MFRSRFSFLLGGYFVTDSIQNQIWRLAVLSPLGRVCACLVVVKWRMLDISYCHVHSLCPCGHYCGRGLDFTVQIIISFYSVYFLYKYSEITEVFPPTCLAPYCLDFVE